MDFDELFVISDLHISVDPHSSIFGSPDQLKVLVEHAAACAKERRVGLIINGDFLDLLACPAAEHFNAERTVDWLAEFAEEGHAFNRVFKALRGFAEVENARLVVVLGNHDVELSLPAATEALLTLLTSSPAARGRTLLQFDGCGFRCRVGARTVLCLHGNEYDPWNVLDYEALRAWKRDHARARNPRALSANAGTRMVIEVVNVAKSKGLPFIDLLKPEEGALPRVIAALQVLRPSLDLGTMLNAGMGIYQRKREDEERMRRGVLGPSAPHVRRVPSTGGDLLEIAEMHHVAGRFPLDVADTAPLLGPIDWLRAKTQEGALASLRASLVRVTRDDSTFILTEPDATFERVRDGVGDDVSVTIAGHTHLARDIAFGLKQNRRYLNTGTWARLIQVHPSFLAPEHFDAFLEALLSPTLDDLERVRVDGRALVIHRRTVAHLRAQMDGQTSVSLRHVPDRPNPSNPFESLVAIGSSI
jgi:UDP-2,3-diacylglucosamine pyrophosphatase LpxH